MGGAKLDQVLKRAGHVIVPGVFDALSARLAARAGAELIYMISFGVPDIGLVSATEMVERVRVAASCAPVPLRCCLVIAPIPTARAPGSTNTTTLSACRSYSRRQSLFGKPKLRDCRCQD
jgi:hypothetical protein